MKIVQITNCFPPNAVGGAERSAEVLRNEFIQLGHSSTVITLRTNMTEPPGPSIVEVPLLNIYDPWRGSQTNNILKKVIWKLLDFFNIAMLLYLIRELLRIKPNIVLCHNLKGISVAAWLACYLTRTPVVHVLHDYYLVCSKSNLYRNGATCTRRCAACQVYTLPAKVLASTVRHFIGVSDFIAQTHVQHLKLDPKKVSTVRNTRPRKITQPYIKPTQQDAFPAGKLRVGLIGRLDAAKGISVLFAAMQNLNKIATLYIAGNETETNQLKKLHEEFPDVEYEYFGHVKPEEIYSAIDVAVFPALWPEPLSAAYEAFEFGVPVIVSDAGGGPEVVNPGITGLVFRAGDVAALTQALHQLAASDGRTLAELSRGALLESTFYNTSLQASKFINILRQAQTTKEDTLGDLI